VSKKLGIGGSGESESAAIQAFKRSWLSLLKGSGDCRPNETQPALPFRTAPRVTGSSGTIATRRIVLSLKEYAGASKD
jgi:hypothetical protein